jgi:hypothetical protein
MGVKTEVKLDLKCDECNLLGRYEGTTITDCVRKAKYEGWSFQLPRMGNRVTCLCVDHCMKARSKKWENREHVDLIRGRKG